MNKLESRSLVHTGPVISINFPGLHMSGDCCEPQPRARGGSGPLVVKDISCEMAFPLYIFFPSILSITSFPSILNLGLGLPFHLHILHMPLFTHVVLLYLYETQLSYLTSLHTSICPSSLPCIFSHCPHCLPLHPNKFPSSSISFPHSILPLHPIFSF